MAASSISRFPGLQAHSGGGGGSSSSINRTGLGGAPDASSPRHPSPFGHLTNTGKSSPGPFGSSSGSSSYAKKGGTEQQLRNQSSHPATTRPAQGAQASAGGSSHNQGNVASNVPVSPPKLERVDTHDLKGKLAAALGTNGPRYWASLLAFMTAKIDRSEFEDEAAKYLPPQHVHLHNSLILGLLYNASADVPGPSAARPAPGNLRPHHDADGMRRDGGNDVVARLLSDTEDGDASLAPPKKRLRLLTAGLSRKERARIRSIPKTLVHTQAQGGDGASSLGWAGAGADMLEKKRKEEEKRKSAHEKKRAKEAYSEIGAHDWKARALKSTAEVNDARDRLALSTQQELVRALSAPLCVQSKQLPDLDAMRDTMTLHAVEAGLFRGAQPQAAALLLAALQCHLQNVMASIISKIRANRQMGIRATGVQRTASDEYALMTDIAAAQSSGTVGSADDSFDSANVPSPSVAVSRPLRNMAQDVSSMTSSTTSLGLGNSLADSSMVSLVSTAPTSAPPGSTSSEVPAAASASQSAGEGLAVEAKPVHGEELVDDDEQGADDATSSGARSTELGASTLELRHLAFLLDLAPHTVVEGLGQGTQERLLASDWTNADEDAQRALEWTGEGLLQRQARAAAMSKLSAATAAAQQQRSLLPPSTANMTPQQEARMHNIIDQLAPVRVLDRRTLAETQASRVSETSKSSWHVSKGGLRLPSTAAGPNKENALKAHEKDKEAAAAAASNAARQDKPGVTQSAGAADVRNAFQGAPPLQSLSDDSPVSGSRTPPNVAAAAAAASAAAANASTAAHANRHGSDPHLLDVVDPVALLASLVN